MVAIEKHKGIYVLRDDLLLGGTKSVLMPYILKDSSVEEWVYASPVCGGFQISLSAYCKKRGVMATIVTPERKKLHINTLKCMEYGAKIIEDKCGFLSGLEKKAVDYCKKDSYRNRKKVKFGVNNDKNRTIISKRVDSVIKEFRTHMYKEPDEIWCAVGSGLLAESIHLATISSEVIGVQVGKEYENHLNMDRFTLMKYNNSKTKIGDMFSKISPIEPSFPSMPNYDLKAWEYCLKYSEGKNILFWNVM